jgi:hypothetical protein
LRGSRGTISGRLVLNTLSRPKIVLAELSHFDDVEI